MSVQEYFESLKLEYSSKELCKLVAKDFEQWCIDNGYMEGDL